jgi:hypothetical protein
MLDEKGAWTRQNEAFWRAHHEAWKRSDLNQRQYCEAEARHSGDLEEITAIPPGKFATAHRDTPYG